MTADIVAIHALPGVLLATHPRAGRRGTWGIDPTHWDGLPDGHTRAVVVEPPPGCGPSSRGEPDPLAALLARSIG